jgi:hypothetical protein
MRAFSSGFHLLQIYGEVKIVDAARDKILEDSPIRFGWWALFSPITPQIVLERPIGLTQIISVTFSSELPWLEDALPIAFAIFGKILSHTCIRCGLSDFYCVVLEYRKPYFEAALRLQLPDRDIWIELNYKGLAFCCFSCGLLTHSNLTCPSKHPAPSPLVVTQILLSFLIHHLLLLILLYFQILQNRLFPTASPFHPTTSLMIPLNHPVCLSLRLSLFRPYPIPPLLPTMMSL